MTFKDWSAPLRPIWAAMYALRPKKYATMDEYSMRSRKCSLPGIFRMASQYMVVERLDIAQTRMKHTEGNSQPLSANMFGRDGMPVGW